jgi:AraC-like DNA-binding protein
MHQRLDQHYVVSPIAVRILDAVVAAGFPAQSFCQTASVDLEVLQRTDGRVTMGQYLNMWAEGVRVTGNVALPIIVAKSGGGAHNLLRFITAPSRNIREALVKVTRYIPILTDTAPWTITFDGRGAIVCTERIGWPGPGFRFAAEFVPSELIAMGRVFTDSQWSPSEVHFMHARPGDDGAVREFLGADVRYGQPGLEIHFPREVLELPLRRQDPSEAAFFERFASTMLGHSAPQETMVRRVRELLGASPSSPWPPLEQVAQRLGLSARTLRRRLHDEGTTFQEVLDAARFEFAKARLGREDLSLSELAFELGFSELSAFYRAFRRWTGMTPVQYVEGEAPINKE